MEWWESGIVVVVAFHIREIPERGVWCVGARMMDMLICLRTQYLWDGKISLLVGRSSVLNDDTHHHSQSQRALHRSIVPYLLSEP
jgi:hypothetical protein